MHIDFSAIQNSSRFMADKRATKIPVWLQLLPPFWVVAIVWFVIRIPVLAARQKQRQVVLTDFAKNNNFLYSGVDPIANSRRSLLGGQSIALPYEVITVTRIFDRLSGTWRDMWFEYVSATIKVNTALSGNRPTGLPVTMTIFRLHLPVDVPNIYIEAKNGYHRGLKLPASDFIDPMEYVLEGDFPLHYRVIGEQSQQLDIYTILTPDVMRALVDNPFYDIWLHDRELLLIAYTAGRQQYFIHTPTAFQIANLLTREIDRIARTLLHKKFEARPRASRTNKG